MHTVKRHIISVFLISSLLCGLCQSQNPSAGNECYDCARRGVLLECTAYDPANLYGFMTDETGRFTEEGLAIFYSSLSIILPKIRTTG